MGKAQRSHSDGHDDFGGLSRDLASMSRRRMFGILAGGAAGVALVPILASCADQTMSTLMGDNDGGTSGGSCAQIPTETAGPYPGDGTNGANALVLAGIVRSDIRQSIGSSSGIAEGIEMTVSLTLVSVSTCEPIEGAAVYLWHCDRGGNYSMYSAAIADENYLRGVQITDASGRVTFTTIFPACYSGRWPHMHFEIYASAADATNGANKLAVSQLALPKSICDTVYATSGYEQSVGNLSAVSLATDNVFSDGTTLQIPTMSGSIDGNLSAALTVAI